MENFDSSELFGSIRNFLGTPDTEDFQEVSSKDMLTSVEIQTLILALASKRGDDGFAEEEMFNLIKWAEKVRIEESLLGLILSEDAMVDYNKDGELVFSLTAKGKKAGDALL